MTAKKKPTRKKKRVPKVKKLTGADYWKFRFYAEMMDGLRLKKIIAEKEQVIASLRSAICGDKIAEYEEEIKTASENYDDYRLYLEDKYKVRLENVNIDSDNYTIHGGVDGTS